MLAAVAATRAAAARRALERDPRVGYVEPNNILRATTSDPHFDQLWGLQAIDAPEAWGVTTGSADVVVGVIDSGVDFSHPDLAGARWRCCSFVLSVKRPDGVIVGFDAVGDNGGAVSAMLSVGTSSVLLDPQAANAGNVTLSLS